MKLLGGLLIFTSALSGCADGPTSEAPAPVPVLRLLDLDADSDRVGVAGVSLVSPLRLQVLKGGVPGDGVPASGVLVRWTTTSGKISPETTLTDAAGIAIASWTPGKGVGTYSATAEVPSSTRRRIIFDARVFEANTVLFATNEGYSFRSARNGSSPAVDTIGVGDTLIWRLDPYDYDERYVDTFGAADIVVYSSPLEGRGIYRRPGTFEYRETLGGARGTVVVR